jgi:hypothetical protein
MTVRQSGEGTASRELGPGGTLLICPVCGCPRMLFFNESLMRGLSASVVSQAIASGEIHMSAENGELWVCERTFEAFKETKR